MKTDMVFFSFLEKFGPTLIETKDKEANKITEKIIDMLGIVHLEAITRNDQKTIGQLTALTNKLFSTEQEASAYECLKSFLAQSRANVKKTVDNKQKIVFVMGHKNPDTDTVISALFEAYRNSLVDKTATYVPVLQAETMPDEIKKLLGKDLTADYISTSEQIYKQAKQSGLARWILVDHNISGQQKFAISIVDHHILSRVAQKQNLSLTWEMVGSCSAQIALKLYGLGIKPDSKLAQLLLGATLMDTENRGPKKMTYRDSLIMNDSQMRSGGVAENEFFQDLMTHLLGTSDAKRLFERDYKADWGIWGFSVAKVKGVFDRAGNELKPSLLKQLVKQAKQNNLAKNYALTIVKVVDYKQNNETVNRERIYLIFNQNALPEFKTTMFAVLEKIINFEFKGRAKIKKSADFIEFWNVEDQLSRKVTAPKIEPIIAAFNEYYFSPKTKKYVSREFLKANSQVLDTAKKLGINLTTDKENRITGITFIETKRLLSALGFSMLSLKEYWQVVNESRQSHDEQMQKHLVSPNFVEFLDTVIINHREIINHPEVVPSNGTISYQGPHDQAQIPEALPGLIYPDEIDLNSGLPKIVHMDPDKYHDPKSWRYWSPDSNVAIPTRGYIFLLAKPSLDTKFHPDDALPNLGIRPCADKVPLPKVKMIEQGSELKIEITGGL